MIVITIARGVPKRIDLFSNIAEIIIAITPCGAILNNIREQIFMIAKLSDDAIGLSFGDRFAAIIKTILGFIT
ncbi:hypothetical protein [Vibrio palustris]|uniref:hypothetical protein n=1 Tax=Vibrio palustris TaxID=1918946 RepID=UPI001F30708C|nr:hypothetical protein [Vibrio palustris]